MSAPAYFPLYHEDFVSGTRGMEPELRGVYIVLLCLMYGEDGSIADNERRISHVLEISTRLWRSYRSKLLDIGKLSIPVEGRLSNGRVIKEIMRQKARIMGVQEARRAAGKASAANRASARQSDSENPKNANDFKESHQQVLDSAPVEVGPVSTLDSTLDSTPESGVETAEKPNEINESGQQYLRLKTQKESKKEKEESLASLAPPARARKATGAVKTTIPDDWSPSKKSIDLATSLGFDSVRVGLEADQMRDWAVFKQVRGSGWDSRFNNWLRVAADRDRRVTPWRGARGLVGKPGEAPPFDPSKLTGFAALKWRMDQADREGRSADVSGNDFSLEACHG